MRGWHSYLVYVWLCVVVRAGPVVRGWNNHTVLPINELALIADQQFPQLNFDPPLSVRGDNALFLSVALVDSADWINMALNSFVSLARFHNISGLTIMTTDDKKLGAVFRKLGLFTYDAKPTIATFPEDFRLEKPLPSWSWGAIIFLRFNAWFEAFRRGIGFCSIDTDVTYNREVFFVKSHGPNYVDIAMQGQLEQIDPTRKNNNCIYAWTQKFNDKFGYYVNPGFACHAYNDKTLKMMQDMQRHIAATIKDQISGWGQPAYHVNFCENEFEYRSPSSAGEQRWHWKGKLKRHNISVSLFAAPAPPEANHHAGDVSITPKDRPHVRAYHAKSCHGADRGDTKGRVKCKEDWLKAQGQWFLPEGLPRGLKAWSKVDAKTVAKLKALLHPRR